MNRKELSLKFLCSLLMYLQDTDPNQAGKRAPVFLWDGFREQGTSLQGGTDPNAPVLSLNLHIMEEEKNPKPNSQAQGLEPLPRSPKVGSKAQKGSSVKVFPFD